MATHPTTPAALSHAPGASRRWFTIAGSGGVRQKDGIEMRRKQDRRAGALRGQIRCGQNCQHIAGGVGLHAIQACFEESRREPLRTLLLAVQWRGNAHQIDLPIHDGFGIRV